MLQPRRSIPNQPGNMQLYDAPNCDYEPPKNFQQNFGNPYDCPENFYNASMMSSAGYSQVADYQAHMAQGGSGKLLPGQIIAQQAAQQQQQQQYGQYPQPHAECSTDTVIYKGGPPPPQQQPGNRGPLPNAEEEFPPPLPERGSGQGSAENSFSDSNSTTQSNVTSECSEAECDREPLVKTKR